MREANEENPIFKPHDIYNVKVKARSETLGSLTPIQALIRQLHSNDKGPHDTTGGASIRL